VSKGYFAKHILPMARDLEARFKRGQGEFEPDRRFDPLNHTELFGLNTTCVGDGTPYPVVAPSANGMRHMVENGKDKDTALKGLFLYTHTGLPVAELGLCKAKAYDAKLMRRVDARIQTRAWEMRIGDCHFSTALNFISPPKKMPNQPLTDGQYEVYNAIQLVRAQVEKGMRQMKLFGMFQTPYRGSWRNFQTYFKIGAHLRARDMYIQADAGFPFAVGYGPFPHCM
jgi:hypothetical protein